MCSTCGCGEGDVRVTTFDDAHDHAHAHTHQHPHDHAHDHMHLAADPELRTHTLDLEVAVLAKNDDLAARNRAWLRDRGITTLNLMSSPGAGKTTLLERTIAFQVFEVYPWAGLLRGGGPDGPAVRVLDRCRVRVGEVLAVDGEEVTVSSRLLAWDHEELRETVPAVEDARWSDGGRSLIDVPAVGDLVALHWDWVCEVVTPDRARTIVEREERQRAAVGLSRAGR